MDLNLGKFKLELSIVNYNYSIIFESLIIALAT